MELSQTIKKLRAEKGWSQEALAERAYVSRQTVSNWECEKSYPDVHSLLILSDIFGVTLDELIKGDVEVMKETIKNDDVKTYKKMQWLGIAEWFALMAGATALVDHCGEFGKVVGCLLAGILSVSLFMTFHKMEQIKQTNDVQTYREVMAFLKGETLDDIEKEKELKRRRTQKILFYAVAAYAVIALTVGGVILYLDLR